MLYCVHVFVLNDAMCTRVGRCCMMCCVHVFVFVLHGLLCSRTGCVAWRTRVGVRVGAWRTRDHVNFAMCSLQLLVRS